MTSTMGMARPEPPFMTRFHAGSTSGIAASAAVAVWAGGAAFSFAFSTTWLRPVLSSTLCRAVAGINSSRAQAPKITKSAVSQNLRFGVIFSVVGDVASAASIFSSSSVSG